MDRNVPYDVPGGYSMTEERDRNAQELIATVYGRIRQLREEGKEATAIILPPEQYRVLQEYRGRIGDVPEGFPDYLGKYDLFGIPLYTDQRESVVIRAKRMESTP
jgi:hypothetical protein